MDKSLLDTDIFSEVLKGVDPQKREKGSSPLLAQLAYLLSLKTMNTKARLGVRSGCDVGSKMRPDQETQLKSVSRKIGQNH